MHFNVVHRHMYSLMRCAVNVPRILCALHVLIPWPLVCEHGHDIHVPWGCKVTAKRSVLRKQLSNTLQKMGPTTPLPLVSTASNITWRPSTSPYKGVKSVLFGGFGGGVCIWL